MTPFVRLLVRIATTAIAILAIDACALRASAIPAAQDQNQDQGQDQPPPSFAPEQLDQIVSRIALYPDPLLAQILSAATFPDQISDAAAWADQHHYLNGEQLSQAINSDQLPWDPSVQALLPFPSVLDMMASDMNWTNDLGNATLAQRPDVMDAVQRERQKARNFGYLRSNQQIVVSSGPYIEIQPVNPGFIVVPTYDPLIVYARPRPGFFVGGAIGFGFGVGIGTYFRPWGWGASRFGWHDHIVYVNNARWNRTWVNRRTYVHSYPAVHRYAAPGRPGGPPPRVVEHHELVRRSDQERRYAHEGHPHVEEHARPHEEHRH
jgi:hypothetical protein